MSLKIKYLLSPLLKQNLPIIHNVKYTYNILLILSLGYAHMFKLSFNVPKPPLKPEWCIYHLLNVIAI